MSDAPKNLFEAGKGLAKDTVGEMIEEGKQSVQGYPGQQTSQQIQEKKQREVEEEKRKREGIWRARQNLKIYEQDRQRIEAQKKYLAEQTEQEEVEEKQEVKQLEVVKKNEREEQEQIAIQRKRTKVENKGVGGG